METEQLRSVEEMQSMPTYPPERDPCKGPVGWKGDLFQMPMQLPSPSGSGPAAWRSLPIASVRFSHTLTKALHDLGLRTIGDVADLGDGLSLIRSITKSQRTKIAAALAAFTGKHVE